MKIIIVKRQQQTREIKEGELFEPQHLKQLAESGIDPKFAAAHGLRSVSARYIKETYGWNVTGGGLNIPYYKSESQLDDNFSRVRLDVPINAKAKEHTGIYNKKQTPVRYLSRKGAGNRLYIVEEVWRVLGDVSVPLYFVEGEKKALKMVQDGYMAIGVAGIYGGFQDGKLLPDFDLINLIGRISSVAFDGDKYFKREVYFAERKLALAILERSL